MPLELRPMRKEDIPAYDRILNDAFEAGGIFQLFYPNGYKPEDREHSYTETLKHMQDPVYRYMLVVDTDLEPLPQDLQSLPAEVVGQERRGEKEDLEAIKTTTYGRPIGISVWKFFEKDRTDEEIAEDDRKAGEGGFAPNADREFMTAFFGAIGKAKREILKGRRHVLLHILGTDPAHHRRGVGAKALEWGLAEADRLGCEAYLEASDMGRPLYARWGFEAIGPLEFDPRAMGRDRDLPHTLMLRPAKRL